MDAHEENRLMAALAGGDMGPVRAARQKSMLTWNRGRRLSGPWGQVALRFAGTAWATLAASADEGVQAAFRRNPAAATAATVDRAVQDPTRDVPFLMRDLGFAAWEAIASAHKAIADQGKAAEDVEALVLTVVNGHMRVEVVPKE